MPVIGTAGHVDHGKSTLVQALTGIDPDRLAEEKRRGLTIDLGFAWLTTPAGHELGIVDVPGHERFIKNMLAGAGSVNMNLFVVAANEGWMPQSQEHLDILDLLGVGASIVVVTKADLVDADTLELVKATVAEQIAATALAGSPILAVSATTGAGIKLLLDEIDALVERTPAPPDLGRPRMWIDRVFKIKGSGTVVTGTLAGGSLATEQLVEVLPGHAKARIRSIQSHRRRLENVDPGNRTALNLVGADESVARGDTIGAVGAWRTSDRLVASLRFVEHLDYVPTQRGAYKFHIGSVEVDATLRFLQTPQEAGEPAIVAIRLARPTVMDFSDHFILRDAGRKLTVGGGFVLEPHPGRLRGDAAIVAARARLAAAGRLAYLSVLLDEAEFLPVEEIFIRTGLHPDHDLAGVELLRLPTYVVSTPGFERIRGQVLSHVRSYQQSHPLDTGLPLTTLRAALGLDRAFLTELVGELARRNLVVADATAVRTPEFVPRVHTPEKQRLMDELTAAGASPPTIRELGQTHGADLVRAVIRAGELIQVSDDHAYPAEWIRHVKQLIAEHIAEHGPFTVAEFRDMVGTTRKYAVPFLEYLDRSGFTLRDGNLRKLGHRAEV